MTVGGGAISDATRLLEASKQTPFVTPAFVSPLKQVPHSFSLFVSGPTIITSTSKNVWVVATFRVPLAYLNRCLSPIPDLG